MDGANNVILECQNPTTNGSLKLIKIDISSLTEATTIADWSNVNVTIGIWMNQVIG